MRRFVHYTFSETKPQMVPTDQNIGFQGLALIQGQSSKFLNVSHQIFKTRRVFYPKWLRDRKLNLNGTQSQ